uniref:Insulin n=1 Tax=Echeneis naucrates TaxID=173247 RepID=A0A665TEG5_ECHNA
MAVLWLHAGSLLLLLVLSSPGSQAVPTPQYLCGSHLIDALYLICGDKGFFYNGVILETSEGRVPVGSENQGDFQDHRKKTVRRSIISNCCTRPCTIFELQNYCN